MHDIHADLTMETAKKLQDIILKAVPVAQKTHDYADSRLGHKSSSSPDGWITSLDSSQR